MTAASLNSTREKTDEAQTDEVASCPSRRRIGIEKLGRTSHVTFHSNGPKHDRSFYQSRMSKPKGRKGTHWTGLFPSLSPPFAPLRYIFLMDSVGNPCGTDYIVEGSGFDRLQISTTARRRRAPKVEISANPLTLTLFSCRRYFVKSGNTKSCKNMWFL